MHPLDHLVTKPLRAALEGRNERCSPLYLRFRWSECAMAWRNLIRVNHAFAIETEPPPLPSLPRERIRIIEAIEHAVERGDSGGSAGEHNHLQRRGKRFPRR